MRYLDFDAADMAKLDRLNAYDVKFNSNKSEADKERQRKYAQERRKMKKEQQL